MSKTRDPLSRKSRLKPMKVFRPKPVAGYCMLDEENNIGLSVTHEMSGIYNDNVAVGHMTDEAANLDKARWGNVLSSAFDHLAQGVKDLKDFSSSAALFKMQGASVLTNVMVGSTIYTAALGNCDSYVVILGPNREPMIRRLIPTHTVDNPAEAERVAKIPGTRIANGRVYQEDGLAHEVTRELGDSGMSAITHNPDIASHTITIRPEEALETFVYVITATEGLTAPRKMTESDIARIIYENQAKAPHEIAAKLTEAASRNRACENLSVIVTPMDPKSKTPKYAAVATGHFQPDVARYAVDHMNDALEVSLAAALHPEMEPFDPEIERTIAELSKDINDFVAAKLLLKCTDEVLRGRILTVINGIQNLLKQYGDDPSIFSPEERMGFIEHLKKAQRYFNQATQFFNLPSKLSERQIGILQIEGSDLIDATKKLVAKIKPVEKLAVVPDAGVDPLGAAGSAAEILVIPVQQAEPIPIRKPDEVELIKAMKGKLEELAIKLDDELRRGKSSRLYDFFHDFNRTKLAKWNAVLELLDDCANSDVSLDAIKAKAKDFLNEKTHAEVVKTSWPLKSRTVNLFSKIAFADKEEEFWDKAKNEMGKTSLNV